MRFRIKYPLGFVFCFYTALFNAQIDPFIGIIDVDSCSFASSCSYLSIDANSLWQQGNANKSVFQTVQPVLITDTINAYPINAAESFELHWPVYQHSFFNFILTFEHSMDTPHYQDGGRIEISYDYGQTWLSVEEDANSNIAVNTQNFYQTTDTLFDGDQGFSGQFSNLISSIQWVWILPLKDMPTDTMYYRFRFLSDSTSEIKDGWMLHHIWFSYAELDGGLTEQFATKKWFEVAPNPTNGQVSIATVLPSFTVSVSDQTGQELLRVENEKTLNLSGFQKGVYWLILRSPQGYQSTQKVILN